MKKIAILLMTLMSALVNPVLGAEPREMIVACGDDQVLILDSEASGGTEVETVWSWRASDDPGLPESYQEYMRTNDDCKPVGDGSRILVTSSSGGVVLVDRKTGKGLFHAHVPNAHSAEYLPGDLIAVALSTAEAGNCIELYDANRPDEVLYRDSLYSGHGVVWIEGLRRLYALGGKELRAYALEKGERGTAGLRLERRWDLPGQGGHDLFPVSDHRLLLTTVDGVWNFDLQTEKFSPFIPLGGMENVKSVHYNEQSGRLIYTVAEEEWWTDHIYCRNPDKVITIPGLKLYKVRIFYGQ